jgi:hypothetical protein
MRRCYRTKTLRNGSIFFAVASFFAPLAFLGPPQAVQYPMDLPGRIIFTSAFASYGLFLLFRVVPAGAYPREHDLRIRNIFSTTMIPWEEIKGFTLQRRRWWNRQPMGYVELKDGRSVHVVAIQANNIGGGAARGVIDELNALLPQRVRAGDSPSPSLRRVGS